MSSYHINIRILSLIIIVSMSMSTYSMLQKIKVFPHHHKDSTKNQHTPKNGTTAQGRSFRGSNKKYQRAELLDFMQCQFIDYALVEKTASSHDISDASE